MLFAVSFTHNTEEKQNAVSQKEAEITDQTEMVLVGYGTV